MDIKYIYPIIYDENKLYKDKKKKDKIKKYNLLNYFNSKCKFPNHFYITDEIKVYEFSFNNIDFYTFPNNKRIQ